jgi:hypothetical protein
MVSCKYDTLLLQGNDPQPALFGGEMLGIDGSHAHLGIRSVGCFFWRFLG